jgi:hypothetical protein
MNEAQAIIGWLKKTTLQHDGKALSDRELAAYLGITRESVNRIQHSKNNCTGISVLPELRKLKTAVEKQLDLKPTPLLSPETANSNHNKTTSLPLQQKREKFKQSVQPHQQQEKVTLLKVTNERVTVANSGYIAMLWHKNKGICTACQARLGSEYYPIHINYVFAVLCQKCIHSLITYRTPTPDA